MPGDAEQELYAEGFATATVQIYEEKEQVDVDDVALMLQSNPAAYFFSPDRDVPRLQTLSHVQGHPGTLSLTTHSVLRMATTPSAQVADPS